MGELRITAELLDSSTDVVASKLMNAGLRGFEKFWSKMRTWRYYILSLLFFVLPRLLMSSKVDKQRTKRSQEKDVVSSTSISAFLQNF